MTAGTWIETRLVPLAIGTACGLACVVVGFVAGIDPALAIGAALGAILVMVFLADLSAGVAVFALVAFMDRLPGVGGPAVGVAKVAGLLLVLSWIATLAQTGETRRDFFAAQPILSYLLLLFLGWCLFSQLWAEEPAETRVSAYRYALNVALLPIVFSAVRQRKHVLWIVGAFVINAAFSAVYGLLTRPDASADLERLTGTIGDPNELAVFLIAGAILAAGLAGAARRGAGSRVAGLGVAALCLIATLFTLSRGGIVTLVLLPVAILVAGGRWRMPALAVWAFAAAIAVWWFVALAPPEARDRVVESDGGSGRTDVWTVGWRMVEDRPVGGVGSGNFQTSSVDYLLQSGAIERGDLIVDEPKVAHNIYLQVLAELGVVGMAIFAAIILICLRCALLAAREFRDGGDRGMELLTRCIAIALIATLIADFFLSEQFSKQLWLLLSLGPALLALARTAER